MVTVQLNIICSCLPHCDSTSTLGNFRFCRYKEVSMFPFIL